MSGPSGNQPPRRGGPPASGTTYSTPRHGRIPSRTGIEPLSPPSQAQQLPSPNHRTPPTVHHLREEAPTPLQRWNGESVTPFMRWAYMVRDAQGQARPNYNYDPDMNNAIYLSETIVRLLPPPLPLQSYTPLKSNTHARTTSTATPPSSTNSSCASQTQNSVTRPWTGSARTALSSISCCTGTTKTTVD
jgi:hypothetical protein